MNHFLNWGFTCIIGALLEHNMLQITIYLSNLYGVWSANN